METGRTTLTRELFEPETASSEESERIAGPSVGFWRDAWGRLAKNRGALVSLFLILAIVAMTFIIGPLLAKYGPYAQDLAVRYQGPSGEYWFGTDSFGRDMWSRVWEGTKVSLYIAFIAAFGDLVIGVLYGMVSGLLGGKVDDVMQRIIEILIGIPTIIVTVLFVAFYGASVLSIAFALIIVGWVSMARIVRAQVLKLREQEFFLASRSLGASKPRLVVKHLLPNSLGPIIITLMITIPSAIFIEAVLSYIGLGIQIPNASLGSLIDAGADELTLNPYMLWIPAAILCVLMIAFNLFADGLRDAFDPRMRR